MPHPGSKSCSVLFFLLMLVMRSIFILGHVAGEPQILW